MNNDNGKFRNKYIGEQLFLDKDLDYEIFLKDVYVNPVIEDSKTALDEFLKKWCEKGNSTSRKKTVEKTPVLMLCGKAGIGKTSFVSEFITEKCKGDIFCQREVIAIPFRDYIDDENKEKIFDSENPWESIKKAFKEDTDKNYDNKLLILDGFDELCVLNGEKFNGHNFLVKLCNEIPVKYDGTRIDVKILITSREYNGYFDEVEEELNKILVRKIEWNENEIRRWCFRYSLARRNHDIVGWCRNFKKSYNNLNVTQKNIFCTPIILYICCHEKIDISDNKSISDIYDKAFKSIVTCQYGDKEFAQDSRVSRELGATILWQFTKEIAYQMFLNSDDEESALVLNKDGIEKAKKIVKDIYSNLNLSDEEFNDLLEKLPAIFHFANGDNDAVEFAHKTVFEYFTAIKLYEDYFVKYSDGYLKDKSIDEKTNELWNSITEAFRYKKIPKDIFEKLNDMNGPRYDGKDSKEEKESNAEKGFDYTYFEKLYVSCMKNDMWFKNSVSSPKEEYISERTALPAQLGLVFRNLTYFLTGHGYTNSNSDKDKTAQYYYENMRELICCSSDLKLSGWNLGGKIIIGENRVLTNDEIQNLGLRQWNFLKKSSIIELLICNNIISEKDDKVIIIYTDLRSADLSYADLRSADFREADSRSADLRSADLRSADLSSAKLSSAYLSSAKLSFADLRSADLSSAKLSFADLRSAFLNSADLSSAYLRYADLSSADLSSAKLSSADLSSAKLSSAYLSSAYLNSADLSSADLSSADLSSAKLRSTDLIEADLRFADLSSADLSYADLSSADLSSADLRYANLTGIRYNEVTKWENAKYNLKTKFHKDFDPKAHGMNLVEYDF